MLYKVISIISVLCLSPYTYKSGNQLKSWGSEICDNGIDDDADGLIDLNDSDCTCDGIYDISYINNASFEEKTDCPSKNSQLDLAIGWEQASRPTTDYADTCGFLGNSALMAIPPLPFPHGSAGVGFRDGSPGTPQWKEYVGTNLVDPLVQGQSYNFEFFVGFRKDLPGNMGLHISLFASDVMSVPFSDTDSVSGPIPGCPTNLPGWDQIEEVYVTGNDEWVPIKFEFIASKNYSSIVIGPGCAAHPNIKYDPYFYLDGLVLADTASLEPPTIDMIGDICDDPFLLQINSNIGGDVQWYYEGVAIENATNPILQISDQVPNGTYEAIVYTENGCVNSTSIEIVTPVYLSEALVTICENEVYDFGGSMLTEAGVYESIFTAQDGCDSVVMLELLIDPLLERTFMDTICLGESYPFFDITIFEAGNYEAILSNSISCDSMITLWLEVIDPTGNLQLADVLQVEQGNSIEIIPQYLDQDVVDVNWYNESGELLSNEAVLSVSNLQESMQFYLEATDSYGCSEFDSIFVRVTFPFYIPNSFSPNGDGVNDEFVIFSNFENVTRIEAMVFDRWGELISYKISTNPESEFIIWDGKFRKKYAEIGVFAYVIEIEDEMGEIDRIYGDVSLIR